MSVLVGEGLVGARLVVKELMGEGTDGFDRGGANGRGRLQIV